MPHPIFLTPHSFASLTRTPKNLTMTLLSLSPNPLPSTGTSTAGGAATHLRRAFSPKLPSSLALPPCQKIRSSLTQSPAQPKNSSTSPTPRLTSPQTAESAQRGAEVDVMSILFKERIVFLGAAIDDFVADAIVSQLLLLDAQDHTKDIRLFINSPGGSLSAALAIFDVIQLVRADVSTVAMGVSASTASLILGGGTKGKRLSMPNTRIMIHQPLGGASGQVYDVEVQAREIMENKTNVTRIISEFTGRSSEQVEKDIDSDRYMSPLEALEYGIIDGVIDRDAIIPLMPVPERVDPSAFVYEEVIKDPMKYLIPEIPDDEIY